MFEKANAYVNSVKRSGFVHHPYTSEQNPTSLFDIPKEAFESLLKGDTLIKEMLIPYGEILGPNLLRGMKNGIICLLVSISRAAIAKGVEYELSLCLSDYYINEVEKCRTEKEVGKLLKELLRHYYTLANEKKKPKYSYHVSNAIVYIRQNAYNEMTVEKLANNEGLEKHYFSTLFKRETGVSPLTFIRTERLQLATEMLKDRNKSITEIASTLCFANASHFCKAFHKQYGMTPLAYRKEYYSRF